MPARKKPKRERLPEVPWRPVLDRARVAHGWSKKQLAERAGLDPSTVREWFSAKRPDPGFTKLAAVCGALGISLDSLLSDDGESVPLPPLSPSVVLRAIADAISDAAVAAEVAEQAGKIFPVGDKKAQPRLRA